MAGVMRSVEWMRAAVKVLEEMGYEVWLGRGGNWPPKKKRGPFLRVVPKDD